MGMNKSNTHDAPATPASLKPFTSDEWSETMLLATQFSLAACKHAASQSRIRVLQILAGLTLAQEALLATVVNDDDQPLAMRLAAYIRKTATVTSRLTNGAGDDELRLQLQELRTEAETFATFDGGVPTVDEMLAVMRATSG